MPNRVAEKVRNCAIVIRAPDMMSWSFDMLRETNAKATATQNEAVAKVRSNMRCR